MAVLAGLIVGQACAQAPDPPWKHADAPLRAVFQLPANQRFALVELPTTLVTNGTVARVVAYQGASARPVRVASTNGGLATLLVNAIGLPPL